MQANDSSDDYVKTETDEMIRPVDPPLIGNPVIIYPVQPPGPIAPIVVIVDPIVINQSPNERSGNDRIPSYDLRDPLHEPEDRGNEEMMSDKVNRNTNITDNRR